ncbi:hypothetical protein BM528_15635 [Alteromonas sp. RW2A1]|uniref:hypothetical protein n=1 Tax=Alteromonas sp. RW2A1 TaxID=1917158 RepID=UPI0009032117|nr:hypothetical protein [Alteromonas sp. RW2A1]APE07033.1 hypothetical protein BM528_15635 [Alteromonas sp. RW2A1]
MNSDEILDCLTEQGGYFEEAKYKGMSLFSVVDPINELNDYSFYLLSSVDANGNTKPKKNNALIFCISAAERLEIAARSVISELDDNEAVTLTYPYFSGGFSKFEKRKNAIGKLQYCGVATSFSSKAAFKQFLEYLVSGRQLDNPFDGYYLNFRKVSHIETLLNDRHALYLLIEEVEQHFKQAIQLEDDCFPLNLVNEHVIQRVHQDLCFVPRINVIFDTTDTKKRMNNPTISQLSATLDYLAALINIARFNVREKTRLKLGLVSDEYGAKKRQYCEVQETIDSIGLYILTQVEANSVNCCKQKLRNLYDVPAELFSLQQLAFFLGVKGDSLGPFLRREQPDGMTVRSKMVTHHDFGNRKKFLTRESFSFLLSSKVSM